MGVASSMRRADRLKALHVRAGNNETRSHAVYLTLRAAIFHGILAESERLQERWLSQVLEVSRTPVREALQRLEAEGFAKDVPRVGLVVSLLTLQEVEDIYALRICLEGMAAQLATRLASESAITVLEQLQAQIEMAQRQRNIEQVTILNAEFHDAICRAGKNHRLAGLVNLLHDSVQRVGSTTLAYPGRPEQATKEHRAILSAIKRRDAEVAKRLAEEHMEHAKRIRLAMFSESSRRRLTAVR